MVNNRAGIIELYALFIRPCPRVVDRFRRNVPERGQPAADKVAVGIKFLPLSGRIKNPEIGSRIGAGRGRPLPAAVIRSEIAVDQLRDKIALSDTPVDKQILHQKAGGNHSQAVVHPPGFIQLAHGGINNRIARFPFLPGL